jgi:hypothetical protein
MEDRTFEELIEELRALRIRETVIIAQLEEANNRTRAGTRETSASRNHRISATANGLKRGDRVRIRNRVRRPATAGPTWNEERERLATVTRVTADQVHITTDNGTRTWRGPNNLQLIEEAQEQ